MNKNIIKSLLTLAAAALVGAGCSVDDFNEKYLDGFDPDTSITDVQNIELTLTDADYSTIASNSTNRSIASAAGEAATAALSAIGTNKYFATTADAAAYIPAFLATKYSTLDDNSTALVTYTRALDIPEDVAAMNAMKSYTLTTADYQKVWGSESDYTEAITPATKGKLAGAISSEGLESGDYVAVTYNWSAAEPTFDKGEEPAPETPALTSVLGTAALDDVVTVTGYISALSSQGPILTDKGGSILIYGNSQTSHLALGEVVTVSGKIDHYNNGFQFGASSSTITQTGATVEVTYPEARVLTGADMDDMLTSRTDKDYYAEFVKVEATIAISGNYYNFNVEGATTAQGSFYGITDAIKAKVSDGQKVTLYGYLSSITKQSGAPKFVSIIVTHVNETPAAAAAAKAAYASAATRAVTMASEQRFAVYQWNGSAFADTDNAVVQPSDYRAMGQSYDNLTDPDQDTYLPQFLNANYPYGKDGDVKYVSYICRKNSANNWATDVYAYDGATWVKTNYFEARTDQFRVANKTWKIDPTLELDYSEMGTQEFKEFLQYCCNWVYDNIDVPLGAPARDNAGDILSTSSIKVNGANPAGSYYVSNYGNNEWYAGTYAYYGEMNWRADNARASYEAAGLGHLSDAEIVAQMQQNAAEVFQNVLHYMYPNVTTENYTKVIIKVYNYFDKPADGSVKGVYSYTFTVVGTGEFEYVPDSFTKL